jgi:hypothetical protein
MTGAINESLGDLVNLTDVYFDRNKITSFPQSLSRLVNLKKFAFDMNPVKEFPNFAPHVLEKNFDSLFPYDCEFSSEAIPWDALTHLNLLNISKNKLTYLPWSFAQKWNGIVFLRVFYYCCCYWNWYQNWSWFWRLFLFWI